MPEEDAACIESLRTVNLIAMLGFWRLFEKLGNEISNRSHNDENSIIAT